jgi:hypothetical protein
MNVAKVRIRMPVMDGGDKRDISSYPFLHLPDSQTRDEVEIQILVSSRWREIKCQ